jgi:rhamnosyl/mannosyltransferase
VRVLHIGKFFPPFAGGMEQFLADLLPALRDHGIAAAALVHGHDHHQGTVEVHHGCPVWRAPCHGRLVYAPVSPSFPRWLNRAIREFRPELLHLHLPNTSAFWALALPAARRLPWLVHWHSDVISGVLDRRLELAYRFYRPFEQGLLRGSRGVLVTSPSYLAASPALQAWRERCGVVPLGLDPARLPAPDDAATARAELLWPGGGCRVLAIGRLTHYKGFEVLIRALAAQPNLQLVIVGGGEQHAGLAKLVDQLGLSNRIRLAGFQADPVRNALLAGCDVFCLPSLARSEAFGVVLLEAMRYSRPVVASDIPGSGVGWVVRQAGHGRLVPPGDAGALGRVLAELATDPAQRQALGQAGERALRQRFAIGPVAGRIAALYRESGSAATTRTAPPASGAGTAG